MAPRTQAVSPPTRAQILRRERTARRRELLEAALRAVRREGSTVSMDAIAAEAGITKPILYRHFGPRAGLAASLAEIHGKALGRALRTGVPRESHPREILAGVVASYVRFVSRDPEVYRFIVSEGAFRPLDNQQDRSEGFGRCLAELLGDRSGDTTWADVLAGTIQGTVNWWLDSGRPVSASRLTEELVELMWGGLSGLLAVDAGGPDRLRVKSARRG